MTPFHLSILTPEHQFFDGLVESLVFTTADGEYAILAHHAPEAVTVVECEIRITQNGVCRRAAASDGFVTVYQNDVLMLLQTCEWPEEIDIRRAERDRFEAQEKMRQKQSQTEYALARSMLARARVRLKVTRKGYHSYNN